MTKIYLCWNSRYGVSVAVALGVFVSVFVGVNVGVTVVVTVSNCVRVTLGVAVSDLTGTRGTCSHCPT